jgi:hypothetical protein
MKMLLRKLRPLADLVLVPFVYPAALLLKLIRKQGVHTLPLCRSALLNVGVFPIRNHYYEPQFDHREPRPEFSADRNLPGIEWNVSGQLEFLERLRFSAELADLPTAKPANLAFHLDNTQFRSGDAEYWYQVIRALKPRRLFEVGSGNSTLMATRALRRNREDDPAYECRHLCIEPYEMPWLEHAGVTVIRKKVEDVGLGLFAELQADDLLFIDSSHVIRPQGDVLFEYLEVLPSLNPGVMVHIHDIFSPRNYLKQWLDDEVRLWNEQYLLEAFLSHNKCWQIVGALNYLRHHHYDRLKAVAPHLTPEREPGSFYIRKVA